MKEICCKTESCAYNDNRQCLYAGKIILREDAVCERYRPAIKFTAYWRKKEADEE